MLLHYYSNKESNIFTKNLVKIRVRENQKRKEKEIDIYHLLANIVLKRGIGRPVPKSIPIEILIPTMLVQSSLSLLGYLESVLSK